MRTRLSHVGLAAAGLAFLVAGCSDGPALTDSLDVTIQAPAPPAFGLTEPPNGIGGCMGDDVVAYNNFPGLPNNEKASWSSTPVPNGNYCTSNDIFLARADVTEVLNPVTGLFVPVSGPITCVEGETFQIKVSAEIAQNANSARSDIGIWVAQPAGFGGTQVGAVTGQCNHYNLVPGEGGAQSLDDPADACGDMSSGSQASLDLGILTLQCTPNLDFKVEVPTCIGWTQPGGDRYCPFPGGVDGSDPINFRMGTVPGTTSKCNCEPFVLDIIVQKQAKLEVRKATVPTDDGGKFNLYISDGDDVVANATDVGNGGTTGAITLSAGTNVAPGATYFFHEMAGFETNLSSYESAWACVNRAGGASRGSGTGAGPESITLQPNDDVICTFTNTRKPRVKVAKVFNPTDDGGKVTFTVNGTLYDNAPNGFGHNGETGWIELGVGQSAAFSEAGFGTTNLSSYNSSWSCDNGQSGSGTSGNSGALGAGATVTCTFTNERKPQVKVKKVFDPTDDGGKVSFTVDGTDYDNAEAGFGHNGETGWIELGVGESAAFSEAGFGGTNLSDYISSWSCTNGTSGNGISGATGALSAGATVTCTFTNVRKPEIKLVKQFVPTDDPGLVSFTVAETTYDNGGAGFGHDGTTGWLQQPTLAAINFSEAGFGGTSLGNYDSAYQCTRASMAAGTSGNGTSGSITPAAGDRITCTFTNSRKPRIIVQKTVVGGGTQMFDFTRNPGNVTFSLGNGEQNDSGFTLMSGTTYRVCEVNIPVGWTTTATLDGNPATLVNPDAPIEDLGNRCVDVYVEHGDTRTVAFTNTPPPLGDARTIGYWSNWSSCSGGNQYAKAIAADNEDRTLDGNLPLAMHPGFTVTSCQQGVNVLMRRDNNTGQNKSNDGAYALASQLLAAQLNVKSGAASCTAANNAIASGSSLLAQVGFTGVGDYLRPGGNPTNRALRDQALSLAGTLDAYNNNMLCS